MPAHEHFSKAPIIEAIIDVRTTPANSGVAQEAFDTLASALQVVYPDKQAIVSEQLQFVLGEQPASVSARTLTGVRLVSANGRYICQAHIDGFTFSVLAPYSTWEEFRDEARRVWSVYRDLVPTKSINRAAIRYINRLDVPNTGQDIRHFVRTYPEVSTDAPQLMAGYYMQITLMIPEIESVLVINQTLVPPPDPKLVSIVLDLDLYREDNVPQDEDELWLFFEELRGRKNAVFSACLTERTKELIR